MSEQTTYYHDGAGRLTGKVDAKNQQAEYVYDDAGRLVDIRYYTQSGGATPVKTVTFGYNNQGNLVSYDDGTTSAAYDYDDLNRKIAETVNYGAFSKSNAYTYYKNGLKQTFTGPDGISYGYMYDDNNQLTGVQMPNLGFISITRSSSFFWAAPTPPAPVCALKKEMFPIFPNFCRTYVLMKASNDIPQSAIICDSLNDWNFSDKNESNSLLYSPFVLAMQSEIA